MRLFVDRFISLNVERFNASTNQRLNVERFNASTNQRLNVERINVERINASTNNNKKGRISRHILSCASGWA